MGKEQLPVAIKAFMRPATLQEEIKWKAETKDEKLQINIRVGNGAKDSREKKKKKQNNTSVMKAPLKDMLTKL